MNHPHVRRLFSADDDPHRLPTPTRPRFTLLRLGLQNLWEYDTTTRFIAEDGRLLLRGHNESGKTKAVELTLPAILDAILRPERLDPFGEQARPMRENLIGPHTGEDVTVVVGYSWAEFGRLDEGHPCYQTAGYGVRASRNASGFTPWFFLTDLRPDVDLDLFVDGRPRSQRDLEEALGGRGRVFDHAADYRTAVNRALFGFDELAQFDNLMRLLIELRRPQLAKQLRPSDLSDMLSASLPSLDVNLVTKVAENVDRLEEHRAQLEAQRATLATVAGFNRTYRRYLQAEVAERAAAVRGATTRVDDASRSAGDARAKLRDAGAAKRAAAGRRERLGSRAVQLETRVQTLRDSDAYRAVRGLSEAEGHAALAAGEADKAGRRLTGERDERDGLLAERAIRQAAAEEHARRAGTARDAAGAAARVPGLHADQQQAAGRAGAGDLDGAQALAVTAVARTRDRIAELRPLDAAVAGAGSQVEQARQRMDLLAEQATEAGVAAGQAAAAAGAATAEFRRAVVAWAGDLEELALDPDLRDELEVVQVDWVRGLVDEAAGAHRAGLTEQLADVGVQLRQAQAEHQRLIAEHDRLAREAYPLPDAPSWRQRRPDRPGAPLYLLAAFRDGALTESQQAAVEAALEAGGLLDAWVHPDGVVEHPEHDLRLRHGPVAGPAGSLLEVLEPVAAGDVDEATAGAVLAGIGLGAPAAGRDTWVGTDGRFRVGRLDGRHLKPHAQYVGRGVRERNRRRRLAELAEHIVAAGTAVAELAGQDERLRGRLSAVERDLGRFPPLGPVERARAEADAADRAARRLQVQADEAERELTARQEELTAATYARDQAAARVGLTLWTGRLEDFARLVNDYERVAAGWLAAEQRLLEARELLTFTEGLVAQAERRCAASEQEAAERRTLLVQARERVAALRRVVTAGDGQEVLTELREAERELGDVNRGLGELAGGWDDLVAAAARAERDVEITENAHEQAREQRAAIAAAFKRLAVSGLVRHAANVDGWPQTEPTDWSETTALQVARRTAEALQAVDHDEHARNRAATNLNRAFQQLTVALPTELPVTPRTEHGVAVYAVVYDARERSLFGLADLLAHDIRTRERRISEEDAQIIDEFLSGEVRDNLRRTLLEARRLVDRINADLETRTTPSGQTVNLDWRVGEDAPAGTAEAVELLRTTPGVSRRKDEALRQFLKERLEQARADSGEASVRDRLVDLFDYRRWHRFTVVQRHSPKERWTPLTRKVHGKGSGGSKAATLHLPLFAAAAAFYASARPIAPRLVVLDEAFAGIDAATTAKLLDLTVQWDLDLVMTSWREWMCFPEVPGLSIYELVRDPDAHVVDNEWFVWDGTQRREMAS